MSVGEALRAAAERLASASDTARLDAELLMAHALGVSRSDMLLRHMRDLAPESFAALIERRERHEPVAYITGSAEFFGLALNVSPATLIPRGDSEALVEAALERVGDRGRAIDLGLKLRHDLGSAWSVSAGWRMLDGGVDNDGQYNFARFESWTLGVSRRF